ncbi:MAG: transposase, partial [Acidimicrobiales bacterium]
VLHGRELTAEVSEAAELLATVVGQDLEAGDDGVFRIARRVAADRVISTVDPDARHGHKTAAHGFDGYKGHISVDPDSEIITDSAVSAGNVADGAVAGELVEELIAHEPPLDAESDEPAPTKTVYGDCAYGSGEVLADLGAAGIDPNVKTPRPQAPDGHFTKDDFDINLEDDTVTCPAGIRVGIGRGRKGRARKEKQARFGKACATCPLRDQCTNSGNGRVVTVGFFESELAENRRRQSEPARAADYRATRPKVERKLGHLVRRRHGGRRARVRGRPKVAADFNLLAAAVNVARLAVLGLRWEPGRGWATT